MAKTSKCCVHVRTPKLLVAKGGSVVSSFPVEGPSVATNVCEIETKICCCCDDSEGIEVGASVSKEEGSKEGVEVGDCEGGELGACEGEKDGDEVGRRDGLAEATIDGLAVVT